MDVIREMFGLPIILIYAFSVHAFSFGIKTTNENGSINYLTKGHHSAEFIRSNVKQDNGRHRFILTVTQRAAMAKANLHNAFHKVKSNNIQNVKDEPYISYLPNTPAKSFTIPTLSGVFTFPQDNSSRNSPIIVSTYSDYSGFLQCLWNCSASLEDLIVNSPTNVKYIFISTNRDALTDAVWMKNRFKDVMKKLRLTNVLSHMNASSLMNQLHFATVSLSELGNWIPELLQQWMCLDHNCGFDQVKFYSKDQFAYNTDSLVLKRLDARYDWLPSPSSVFRDETLPAEYFKDSCSNTSTVQFNGKIALVIQENCSFVLQILHAQQQGAAGVIVLGSTGSVQDLNCAGAECGLDLHIPATSVPVDPLLLNSANLNVTFQNTPSSNFFMAIDHNGDLQEVGWFLYPTMHFLAWQAQWFNYRAELEANLSQSAYMVNVFNASRMQGAAGVSTTVSLPPFDEMKQYASVELDMALGCPGSNDRDCAHWDHTVTLTVCTPLFCDLEIGRWITSFRRRIGRWLTDITPLLPLLNEAGAANVTMTMKTAAWAMPWLPSLNLRFSGHRQPGELYPAVIKPLYNSRGFTFDKHYNSLFKPLHFNVSTDVKTVEIFAVITGHGSDENGCGEFCVTSHTFSVNGKNHSITFDTAGSPLGCADKVPLGSEPNEHGTWLYGRDGWCDGQNVTPWISDVTDDVSKHVTSSNTVHYQGYFNGTDPNPKKRPGVMIFASYLIFYKQL